MSSPTLENYTDIGNSLDAIQSSLDAIQKVWDANEMKDALYENPREQNHPPPIIPTEADELIDELKRSELWALDSCSSCSSSSILETPQTEAEDEDDEDEEMVAKIVANLEAKIRAVKKRKQLAVEVDSLRRELAVKEAELKECERILALEMAQVVPSGTDGNS